MTESHLGGGKADPGSADLVPEIPQTGQIYGHDVRVSYGQRYVVIDWKTGSRILVRFRADDSLSTRIMDRRPEDPKGLVTLRLLLNAGYTRLAVDLPFYAKNLAQLEAFARALQALLRGHADLAPSGTAGATRGYAEPRSTVDDRPPGEAVANRGQTVGPRRPDGTDRPDKRERPTAVVVTISAASAPPADDQDWISLRPPAETERLLRPAREDPAKPVPEISQHA